MEVNIQKAKKNDWQGILTLLEEAGLREYLPDEEFNPNFFVLYDDVDNLICTFTIDFQDGIGVLKSFAVSKIVQGKGFGRKVANEMDKIAKSIGLKKLYASSWEAPEFWKKTIFKEISENDNSDLYFKNYKDSINERFPEYTENTKHFLLALT